MLIGLPLQKQVLTHAVALSSHWAMLLLLLLPTRPFLTDWVLSLTLMVTMTRVAFLREGSSNSRLESSCSRATLLSQMTLVRMATLLSSVLLVVIAKPSYLSLTSSSTLSNSCPLTLMN
ncbi:hypothetical protein DFJ73DRAFT_874007 [Zopfochytrium polystomum]|nr:hypothetical protein DFJ73DRAFT_874007 [Zopfochytrium polystomum]